MVSKIKRIKRDYSPRTVNFFFVRGGLSVAIIGLLLMILAYFLFQDRLIRYIAVMIPGLGASVFAGALINHLWYKRLDETVFDLANKSLKHAGNRIEKIRWYQKILLEITEKNETENGRKYIIINSTHSFAYKEKKYGDMYISSDFRGSRNEKVPISQRWINEEITAKEFAEEVLRVLPIFHYTKISNSAKNELLLWEDTCKKIEGLVEKREKTKGGIKIIFKSDVFKDNGSCVNPKVEKELENLAILLNTSKNKLVYESKFTVSPGQTANFEFGVHRQYELQDRLVWSLQEFSNDLEIQIKVDKKLSPESFFFVLNHPLADVIMSHGNNGRYVAKNCSLRGETATIQIDEIILPYQSFEISWEIRDK